MARSGPRILAGRHRGRTLRVGPGARPTEGRVREALFNIWADRVMDCRFLDLFAGSGAMGLEALSRGAARVTWVEKNGQAVASIRRNLDDLGFSDGQDARHRILRLDLPRQASRLESGGSAWDLIYADPPYAFNEHGVLAAFANVLLAPGGEMAVEHSPRLSAEEFEAVDGVRVTDRRTWGDCAVSFLSRASAAGTSIESEARR